MADSYTNTSEHYLPVPAITDKYSWTRDIQNLRVRVNQGMRGLAAYDSNADNYILAATNAGVHLSGADGTPYGRVASKTNGGDPTWVFQLNDGATLVDKWAVGVDDSDSDAFKIEGAATLGSTPEFKLALTTGNATLKGGLTLGGNATLKPPSDAVDGKWTFQDNQSGTGVDKHVIGYDDSRDSLALSQGTTLGANGAEITAAGALNVIDALTFRGQKLQCFRVIVQNNGGVIQHLIRDIGDVGNVTMADKITGASASLNNTPSVDATTAFVAGVGINAASASQLHFDVPNQSGLLVGNAEISRNSTGTTLSVFTQLGSLNVNGTTRSRLALLLRDQPNGANYNWTSIGVGLEIRVTVFIFLD